MKTIVTSFEPEILKKHFLELFMTLRGELLLIEEMKVDMTYFRFEEFYDIIRKLLEYTAKTRDTHKIHLDERILVKVAILDNVIFRQLAENFLLIILEPSQVDVFAARKVYNQQKDTPEEIIDINLNELNIVKVDGINSIKFAK